MAASTPKRVIVPVLSFLFLVCARAMAQGDVSVSRVTDNVLVIQGLVANMAVLQTGDGLVLVDSLISPLHARNARGQISEHFPNQPVRYLINTHYHPDHNLGNQEFAEATVVTHVRHGDRIAGALEYAEGMRRAPDELARLVSSLESGEESADLVSKLELWHKRLARYSGFRARVADLELDGGAQLKVGGQRISILHFGPGHTDGDLVVHFVDEGVLVTGDLVFRDIVPVIDRDGGVSIDGWISGLDRLLALDDVDHVVPGHGEVGGRGALEEQRRYLADAWRAVGEAHAAGGTLDDSRRAVLVERYSAYTPLFGDVAANLDELWQLMSPR